MSSVCIGLHELAALFHAAILVLLKISAAKIPEAAAVPITQFVLMPMAPFTMMSRFSY